MARVGTLVRIVRDLDLAPHALIREGERGTVVDYCEDTKEITILLDVEHRGLHEWHNTIWMFYPYNDEISAAVQFLGTVAA